MKTGDGTNDPIMIGFFHENEEYGCFSNWYPAEFDYAGRHFASLIMPEDILLTQSNS